MPDPMRFWMVTSTWRRSTRPLRRGDAQAGGGASRQVSGACGACWHLLPLPEPPTLGMHSLAGQAECIIPPARTHTRVRPQGPPPEPAVLVHQVAVPVLLRHPLPRPAAPGRGRGARLVAHAVQSVEHGHVGGQRLLRDHVAHLPGEAAARQEGKVGAGQGRAAQHRAGHASGGGQEPGGSARVRMQGECTQPWGTVLRPTRHKQAGRQAGVALTRHTK